MPKGRWTVEEDRNLQVWIAEGLTVPRISVRLRRTINSVMSRCKSLGLSSGRKTLGKPLNRIQFGGAQLTGTGKKQLIDVPDGEPLIAKEPPSA